jgi:serine/threonine protein kinase
MLPLQMVIKTVKDTSQVYRFVTEIECLRACADVRAEYVIKYHGLAVSSSGRVGYAMAKGQYTVSSLTAAPTPFSMLKIAFQAVTGLCEMRYACHAHRDIKPENAVVDEDGNFKYIDPGLAKPADEHATIDVLSRVGTCYYMAPETLQQGPQSTEDVFKGDVWGAAQLIACVGTKRALDASSIFRVRAVRILLDPVVQQLQDQEQAAAAAAGMVPVRDPRFGKMLQLLAAVEHVGGMGQVLEACPGLRAVMGEQGMDLLKGMLQLQPQHRLSAEEAWLHPYFAVVRQQMLQRQDENPKAFVPGSPAVWHLLQRAMVSGRCRCNAGYAGNCTRCES